MGVTSSTGSGSTGTGGGGTCVPNNDGTITRQEVPLAPGLHATFRVADSVTYDTAGMALSDGSTLWNLDVPFSGDHPLVIDTMAIDPNAWYASAYPGASYAARLSDLAADADLLGIFKLTDSALLLLGVASQTKTSSFTQLIYATPIVVLSFPLTASKTWDTLSAVTGTAQGVPVGGIYGIYNEEYTSTVDAHGTLKTPYADFLVLRVQTKLLRYLDGIYTTKYTDTFTAECFGTVGTIVSNDDETSPEFTSAAELWRFSP
jgi:hypothetical protein